MCAIKLLSHGILTCDLPTPAIDGITSRQLSLYVSSACCGTILTFDSRWPSCVQGLVQKQFLTSTSLVDAVHKDIAEREGHSGVTKVHIEVLQPT